MTNRLIRFTTERSVVTLDLDETDERIVAALRSDARMSSREIASHASLRDALVRQRLRRLTRDALVRVVAVTDFGAVGLDFLLFIGVKVREREVSAVARDLAEIPAVISCNVVIGPNDIEIIAALGDPKSSNSLINESIADIPGVHTISTGFALETLKYQVDMSGNGPRAFLETFHPMRKVLGAVGALDQVDLEILQRLWRNARKPNQHIATEIGVSEGTVRFRIKRMIDSRAIRVQTVINIDVHERPLLSLVGIHVQLRHARSVALHLSQMPETGVVALMTGRYDVMALFFAQNLAHLRSLLLEQLRSIPGVMNAEAYQPIEHVKFDYRFGRVASTTVL